jgi:two-component system, NarL family, nitrate/nitrite response regulator NarL
MAAQHTAPIRVFLVDDHRSILWGLEKLIESAQPAMAVAGSATNCAGALALLDKAAPDVILLDLDLGSESGLDAIPRLISGSKAKVLVLTGLRDGSVHDKAVLAGARGVVEKEASAETILTAITRVHEGQLWLDRAATGRIFVEFSRQGAVKQADPEKQKIDSLTDRERQIIVAIAANAGATAATIAEKLHISEHTLRNHLTAIYSKLGVANRLELFAYAHKHGLIKSPA